ncbi:MAG TPA: hypothetical protein VNJ01_01290 [Bacteriovoracaceae bacterium]|nr:hypothetical protein [Bacteriovoracaceae bacterium]
MAAKFTFYYFGDDEIYFRALQGEFKKSTRLDVKFLRLYEEEEEKIQSLFLKVYSNKASCVFIDFSRQSQDYLHLARIIARAKFDHPLVTVGLVDYLSPLGVLKESIATGVNLTHIKSVETFDVICDVTKLISPADIAEKGFATAALGETWEAGLTCKVGYVHPAGLHLETNHRVCVGDRIRLSHFWADTKVVPSREVFVTYVSESSLFYHFRYAVDVEFLFEDEFLPPQGMEDEKVEEKLQDREYAIKQSKKRLLSWITDNHEPSHEKRAKLMIIDKDFHFYADKPRSDKYPYTIRCVLPGERMIEELHRLQPQMIVFSLEIEHELVTQKSSDELKALVAVLKEVYPEASPFLVIFNSKLPSREMQISLGYANTVASQSEIEPDVVLQMAEAFAKKVKLSSSDDSSKAYIKKTNVISVCEILMNIKVSKLTESDIVFQCETPLPVGSNLHLRTPVEMYVHVQPGKASGKIPEYFGLIHCLGESQKRDLRRYVNSLFFKDHDAKLLSEAEEFKNLNEAKRLEKEQALVLDATADKDTGPKE